MKKALLGMMLMAGGLAGSLAAAPRVHIGIGFGAPAPVVAAIPPSPGFGYTWINGYYAPGGAWVAGYWAPPVNVVAPAPIVRYDHVDRDRGFDRGRAFDRHDDRGGEHFRQGR